MPVRSLVVAALGAAVLMTSMVSPARALEVDPDAPVVVDDAITLWPGEYDEIDVLANDSDPTGDELSLCWLPEYDPWSGPDPVGVRTYSPGVLWVEAGVGAVGSHVVDYYVCSHTRLTPAHLTVTFRPVKPVKVVRDERPGRVVVTNYNNRPVKLVVYEKSGCRRDVVRWIADGATTSVKVHYRQIAWIAGIADGVADLGRLSGIELAGKEGEPGPRNTSCALSTTPYWDESWN